MASETVTTQYLGGPYHGRKIEQTTPIGVVVFPAGSSLDALFEFLEGGPLRLPCYILDPKTHIYSWSEGTQSRN